MSYYQMRYASPAAGQPLNYSNLKNIDSIYSPAPQINQQPTIKKTPQVIVASPVRPPFNLEARVDDVVRQNEAMAIEIDNLQKVILQKKTEADLWKQKYEQQMNQFVHIKGTYEQEIALLSNEIQKVNSRINTFVELDQSKVQGDIRFLNENTTQLQVDALRKAQVNQSECYENQLRKMRELIQDKSLQAEDLQTNYERLRCDYETMQQKLLKENEILRLRISSFEIDRQNEIASLKNKFEFFNHTNTENLKHQQHTQIEAVFCENEKLKGLLEIKNQEIETLLSQNQKQKIAYEQQLDLIRNEVAELKNRLMNNENIFHAEFNDQMANLSNLHSVDITSINSNYQNQIFALENDILRLKELVDNKNREIEQQIIDKQQMKEFYDSEVMRLSSIIEEWRAKFELLDRERMKQLEDAQIRLEREQFNHAEDVNKLNQQLAILNAEIINLKNLVDYKNNEIEVNLVNHQNIRNRLEEEIRNLKNEIEVARVKTFELDKFRIQETDDLKLCLHNQEVHYREKVKQLDLVINHLTNENKQLKDVIVIKSQECENLIVQRNQIESMASKLRADNEHLMNTLNAFDANKVAEFQSLKVNMDQASLYQFDNLKAAYTTQVSVMNDAIKDLKHNLDIKHIQLDEALNRVGYIDQNGQNLLIPDVRTNSQIVQVINNSNKRSLSQSRPI